MQVETHLVRTGTRLALLLLAVVTLSIIAAYDRSLVAGLSAGVGILLTHLAVQFTPDIVGQAGLKLIWPPTGATVLGSGTELHVDPRTCGNGGVTCLCRLGYRAAKPIGRPRPPPRMSRQCGWAAGTGLRQVIVVLWPSSLSSPRRSSGSGCPMVPPAARPSILLQQSQDQAPDQVAAEFFGDLQNGLLQGARSRVSTSESALIENLPRAVFVRGPSQTFQLERLSELTARK